jgi:hypothetical protein
MRESALHGNGAVSQSMVSLGPDVGLDPILPSHHETTRKPCPTNNAGTVGGVASNATFNSQLVASVISKAWSALVMQMRNRPSGAILSYNNGPVSQLANARS